MNLAALIDDPSAREFLRRVYERSGPDAAAGLALAMIDGSLIDMGWVKVDTLRTVREALEREVTYGGGVVDLGNAHAQLELFDD